MNDRQRYHCPPWCTEPPEEHARDLEFCDGGATHWRRDHRELFTVSVGMCTDAAGAVTERKLMYVEIVPAVMDGVDPEKAQRFAEDLLAAIDNMRRATGCAR